jgi:hypothetical protein
MSLVNPGSYIVEPLDGLGFVVFFALFHVTLWSYESSGRRVYNAVTQGRIGPNCFRDFAPPMVYGLVWFVLNSLLAVAAWLTWRRPLAYDDSRLYTGAIVVWFLYWLVLKMWNSIFNTPITWLYVANVVVAAALNIVLIVLTCYATEGSSDFIASLIILVLALIWSIFALSYAIGMHRLRKEVSTRFAALRSAESAQLGYM